MWAHDTGPHADKIVLQQFGYLFASLILLLFVGLLLIFKSKLIPHTTIKDAGHFLQEEKGEELAQVIIDFIAQTP